METETRIAVLSIIVENTDTTAELNDIIHEYAEYMVGRMGIPYRARGINIISLVVDAPQNVTAGGRDVQGGVRKGVTYAKV